VYLEEEKSVFHKSSHCVFKIFINECFC